MAKDDKGLMMTVGAVGVGLVGFGLYKAFAKEKGTTIKAAFTIEYKGPAQTLAIDVELGRWAFGFFDENPDLVACIPWEVPRCEDWQTITGEIELMIPPKQNFNWPLPYTYDANLNIMTPGCEAVYGPVLDQMGKTRDIHESLLTHTEDFQVIMF